MSVDSAAQHHRVQGGSGHRHGSVGPRGRGGSAGRYDYEYVSERGYPSNPYDYDYEYDYEGYDYSGHPPPRPHHMHQHAPHMSHAHGRLRGEHLSEHGGPHGSNGNSGNGPNMGSVGSSGTNNGLGNTGSSGAGGHGYHHYRSRSREYEVVHPQLPPTSASRPYATSYERYNVNNVNMDQPRPTIYRSPARPPNYYGHPQPQIQQPGQSGQQTSQQQQQHGSKPQQIQVSTHGYTDRRPSQQNSQQTQKSQGFSPQRSQAYPQAGGYHGSQPQSQQPSQHTSGNVSPRDGSKVRSPSQPGHYDTYSRYRPVGVMPDHYSSGRYLFPGDVLDYAVGPSGSNIGRGPPNMHGYPNARHGSNNAKSPNDPGQYENMPHYQGRDSFTSHGQERPVPIQTKGGRSESNGQRERDSTSPSSLSPPQKRLKEEENDEGVNEEHDHSSSGHDGNHYESNSHRNATNALDGSISKKAKLATEGEETICTLGEYFSGGAPMKYDGEKVIQMSATRPPLLRKKNRTFYFGNNTHVSILINEDMEAVLYEISKVYKDCYKDEESEVLKLHRTGGNEIIELAIKEIFESDELAQKAKVLFGTNVSSLHSSSVPSKIGLEHLVFYMIPPRDLSFFLIDRFLTHINTIFYIATKPNLYFFLSEILELRDKVLTGQISADDIDITYEYRRISVLLIFMRLGQLTFDLDWLPSKVSKKRFPQSYNKYVGLHLFFVSQFCLSKTNFLRRSNITVLQALMGQKLHIMLAPSDGDDGIGTDSNSYMGLIMGIALGLGLHRDPSNFVTLDEDTARLRRALYGELLIWDNQQSLELGIPFHFNIKYGDTELMIYDDNDDAHRPSVNCDNEKNHPAQYESGYEVVSSTKGAIISAPGSTVTDTGTFDKTGNASEEQTAIQNHPTETDMSTEEKEIADDTNADAAEDENEDEDEDEERAFATVENCERYSIAFRNAHLRFVPLSRKISEYLLMLNIPRGRDEMVDASELIQRLNEFEEKHLDSFIYLVNTLKSPDKKVLAEDKSVLIQIYLLFSLVSVIRMQFIMCLCGFDNKKMEHELLKSALKSGDIINISVKNSRLFVGFTYLVMFIAIRYYLITVYTITAVILQKLKDGDWKIDDEDTIKEIEAVMLGEGEDMTFSYDKETVCKPARLIQCLCKTERWLYKNKTNYFQAAKTHPIVATTNKYVISKFFSKGEEDEQFKAIYAKYSDPSHDL